MTTDVQAPTSNKGAYLFGARRDAQAVAEADQRELTEAFEQARATGYRPGSAQMRRLAAAEAARHASRLQLSRVSGARRG